MQLLTPTLVDVDGRPALLLAQRGDRRFVQVSHGPGDNRLRWVPAVDVADTTPPGRTTRPQQPATVSSAITPAPARAER